MSGLLLLFSHIGRVSGRPTLEITYSSILRRAEDQGIFAPSWVSEPDARGTYRIIYSCLLTLTLCVYTALHLNVPRRGETGLELFWRKTKWVIIAILAPELVLYSAYVQWIIARDLCKAMNNQSERGRSRGYNLPGNCFRKQKNFTQRFSLLYCYYVVMGGIVLDVSNLHDEYTLLTLTPEGLLYLAKKRHFIDVSDPTIKAKSRPEAFAKIVVVFQVIWMVLENCSRLDVGLSVNIIEGHTLIHVVTALAMYTLWFKKPLNICDPTVVNHVAFEDHIASMLMRCTRLGGKASASRERQPHRQEDLPIRYWLIIAILRLIGVRELAQDFEDKCFKLKRLTMRGSDTSESAYLMNYLARVKEVKTEETKRLLQRGGENPRSTSPDAVTALPETNYQGPEAPKIASEDATGLRIHSSQLYDQSHGDATPCRYIHVPEGQESIGLIRSGQHLTCGIGPVFFRNNTIAIELSTKTVRRWEQAANVIQDDHVGINDPAYYFMDGQLSNLPLPGGQGIKSLRTRDMLILVLVFFVLCAGYGGVHCLAWNADFATQLEKNLWRIACVDLVMAGILYFILLAFLLAAEDNGAHAVAHVVIVTLGLGHFAIYVAARIFLVVEAFISVRHLHVEAYETVGWVSWIPHI